MHAIQHLQLYWYLHKLQSIHLISEWYNLAYNLGQCNLVFDTSYFNHTMPANIYNPAKWMVPLLYLTSPETDVKIAETSCGYLITEDHFYYFEQYILVSLNSSL